MILPKQPLECIDFQGFIDSVSVDEPLIWSQRQARQSRFYPRPANSSVLPSFLSFLILFILLFSASKRGCVQAAFLPMPYAVSEGWFSCVRFHCHAWQDRHSQSGLPPPATPAPDGCIAWWFWDRRAPAAFAPHRASARH